MEVDSSQSADSSLEEGEDASALSREATASPRLQEKIDVVQQVLTVLEFTLASGKSTHETSVTCLHNDIAALQQKIDAMKTAIVQKEATFSKFSNTVGNEINKFCALDNILRTVEESRTENDTKILIPDVSKIDGFIQTHAIHKTQEWLGIKEQILRLNSESQKENHPVRCITLRVTIKNNILSGADMQRVNKLAEAFNFNRGKSLKRIYQSNTVPEFSTKMLKVVWNQKNVVAGEKMTTDALLKISKDVFRGDGEVVKLDLMNIEETAPPEMRMLRNDSFYRVLVPSETNQVPEPDQELGSDRSVIYNITQTVQEVPIFTKIIESRSSADVSSLSQIILPTTVTDTPEQQILPTGTETQIENSKRTPISSLGETQFSNHDNNSSSSMVVNGRIFNYALLPSTSVACNSNAPAPVPTQCNLSDRESVIAHASLSTNTAVDKNATQGSGSIHSSTEPTAADELKKFRKANKNASKAADRSIQQLLDINLKPKRPRIPQSSAVPINVSENELLTKVNTDTAPTKVPSTVDESDSASTYIPIENEIGNPSLSSEVLLSPSKNAQSKNQDENQTNEYLDGVPMNKYLIQECSKNGISTLKDLQKKLLPILMDQRDVLCRADRDTGKSTALAISALQQVNPDIHAPQVLIVTPNCACTNEVTGTINNIGKDLMVNCINADELAAGSSSPSSFMALLMQPKSQVLVGVPSSLLQMIHAQKFQNQAVNILMIDDLDNILSQRFQPTIIKILFALNASIKVTVMTRTITASVKEFCKQNLRNPCTVIEPEMLASPQRSEDNIHQGKKLNPVCNNNTALVIREVDKTSGNSNPNDCEMDYEYEYELVPSPTSSVHTIVLDDDDDDVFSTDIDATATESDVESDMGSLISYQSEVSRNLRSISVSRRSSEEIETMICANEIFDGNEEIMTVVPEYMYQALGIPMSDSLKYSNSSDEGHTGSGHFYVLLYDDCLKMETLSLMDIEDEKTVIFCNTIEKVEWLSSRLRQRQLWPQTIHEEMDRSEWSTNLRNFGSFCKLIIATDFLAELTTQDTSLVINYDFPNPPKNYVSRAAFAERCFIRTESCDANRPTVISFITNDNLTDIQDLERTFNLSVRPMSND